MKSRVTDRNDWFDIWFDDKRSIIGCMIRNMAADIEAGYDPMGNSVSQQRKELAEYEASFDAQMSELYKMDEKEVNRWCFYDMKKRGVIE